MRLLAAGPVRRQDVAAHPRLEQAGRHPAAPPRPFAKTSGRTCGPPGASKIKNVIIAANQLLRITGIIHGHS